MATLVGSLWHNIQVDKEVVCKTIIVGSNPTCASSKIVVVARYVVDIALNEKEYARLF